MVYYYTVLNDAYLKNNNTSIVTPYINYNYQLIVNYFNNFFKT